MESGGGLPPPVSTESRRAPASARTEGDVLSVVLVKEAWSLCVSNFESFKFSFSSRVCHTVAHELAKLGRMYLPNQFIEWDSDVPGLVATCALGECPSTVK